MKKYKLHYANLDLEGDIPSYELSEGIELNAFILSEAHQDDCVYLVLIGGESYATDNILLVINFIEKFQFEEVNPNPMNLPKEFIDEVNSLIAQINDIELFDIHIHEYPSFEDAYAVSLDMKEGHPLCYN